MSLIQSEQHYKGTLLAYHALRTLGIKFDLFTLSMPEQARTFNELLKRIKNQFFPPIKIVIIGSDDYTRGMKAFLDALKVKQVSQKHFLSIRYDRFVYTHITQDDLNEAESVQTLFAPYVHTADIVLLGQIILPAGTQLLTQNMLDTFNAQIKVVVDTTEDLSRKVLACTLKNTTVADPFFSYAAQDNKEVPLEHHAALAVIALTYDDLAVTPERIKEFYSVV